MIYETFGVAHVLVLLAVMPIDAAVVKLCSVGRLRGNRTSDQTQLHGHRRNKTVHVHVDWKTSM